MEESVNEQTKADNREQNSRRALVFIVITILLGVNGLLLYQFFDKKSHLEEVTRTLDNTSAERDALSAELQQVKAEFEKQGIVGEKANFLLPFKVFTGNKPTNTILI